MLKSHQPPITVEKQVENLETLGCTVENKEEAIEFLNNVSYFRLIKAYGFGLKERNANYNEGVTFNKIKGLYLFNAKFRHLIPYPLSKVKKIIKKVDSINNITPNLMESLVGKRIKVICEDFLSYIGIVNNFEYNEEDDEFDRTQAAPSTALRPYCIFLRKTISAA